MTCYTRNYWSSWIFHADETSYKVLENDSKLTFYWNLLCLGSMRERESPSIITHKRRSGLVVEEFLGDYTGYVHCDMWSAYRQLDKG